MNVLLYRWLDGGIAALVGGLIGSLGATAMFVIAGRHETD
jgi:hypothetical protein